MKYICTNPFPNPPGKPIVITDIKDESGKVTVKQSHIIVDGVERKEHVHKGAIFSIGTASEFKDLSPAEKTLVSQLAVSKKIAEATPQTIERVNKEVAAEKLIVERDSARDSKSDPLKALADVLTGLQTAVESIAEGQAQLAAAVSDMKRK